VHPVDVSNQLLAPTPATMLVHPTADGNALMLTIRTASTTLTVIMTAQDMKAWADVMTRAAGPASKLIIPGPFGGTP
jgi:hypothetical protein